MRGERSKNAVPGLVWQVAATVLSRLTLNTARRFIYPFAPVLSRGIGVPLEAVTLIIAVNQLTGIMSLLFGPMGDRRGYRTMMLVGMALLTSGMLAMWFLNAYIAVLIAFLFAGLGKSMFDPSVLAYMGEHVPYHRRGLVIGILEMSWAGSSLIGIPVMGLLIAYFGWHSPFLFLGGFGLLGIISVIILIPEDNCAEKVSREATNLRKNWRILIQEPAARGVIGFAFFFSMANDNLFVVYGVWLEETFHLSVAAIGTAAAVIGAAELFGEILTAFLSDRIGKRRSVIIGLALSVFSYMALPLAGRIFPLALTGFFFVFVAVEFTIVTCIIFFTEVLPDARATMISGYITAAGLGRVAGALVGVQVWAAGGIWAVGTVSALITGLAILSFSLSLSPHRIGQPHRQGREKGDHEQIKD